MRGVEMRGCGDEGAKMRGAERGGVEMRVQR